MEILEQMTIRPNWYWTKWALDLMDIGPKLMGKHPLGPDLFLVLSGRNFSKKLDPYLFTPQN